MAFDQDRLRDVVAELATKPGHEKVRALVQELLVHGLGVASTAIDYERPLPEVRGRLDALLGQTVFEFKRDLKIERRDAEEELSRYLAQRERETGERFVGIATDGAEFRPYELRDGQLCEMRPFRPTRDDPRALLVWLDTAVSVQAELPPDPTTIQKELGRESLAFERAKSRLEALWGAVKDHPEARIKRQLWEDLLQKVYGSRFGGADGLFLQHTYLTIVAKTMAARVLDIATTDPADLLSGRAFHEAGISGAVESDFFDWVLDAEGGPELVARIMRQVARFRLHDIEHDVLKGLYESLIDPEQRHDLGEYYTPDWLAARMCERAITEPLSMRVLDPACGSGTFLFHAARRMLAAADAAKMPVRESLAKCTQQILGVDVHPVAVLIARVTYLLALGEARLKQRPASLSIPVYLGDSLQWNTQAFLAETDVLIDVPPPKNGTEAEHIVLHFPSTVAAEPSRFDTILQAMLDMAGENTPRKAFEAWIARQAGLSEHDGRALAKTYDDLRKLHAADRNHIWGYVARNLVRPVWLSRPEQRADVVIGNPPWLSYRYMDKEMQKRFRDQCEKRGLWVGGKLATHQDLSAYFFAQSAKLYLKDGGAICFVMPLAAMTRAQFGKFRTGDFGDTSVRFVEAWMFEEDVQPLLPVPACVLIARREPAGPRPAEVTAFTGTLPRRDATAEEAAKALASARVPWPEAATLEGGSPYRKAFRQGATMVPRKLCLVEYAETGRLGGNPEAPVVRSRESTLDKRPWRDLPPLQGPIEARFLRPLYLGESIAPFRLLEPALAVVPWDEGGGRLLDAAAARDSGFSHLAHWMAEAERLWNTNRRGAMTLVERWDYHKGLGAQFPPPPVRVVYAKAGTLPAAAVLRDPAALVDHMLYWAAPGSAAEAEYLIAILDSETMRAKAAPLQSKGQWGARHFDKVMFEQPIPKFDPKNDLHRALADAARHGEAVAAAVELKEGMHFTRARKAIREALKEDGIAQRIDALVAELLERGG